MTPLRSAIYSTALVSGLSTWLAQHKHQRRIIMLHGVDGVIMSAADLERGLAWLADRFRFVRLDDMVSAIAADHPIERGGEIALTFDDGLRNQVEVAYPVLKRLGVPATFFICPDLIENRRWIWTQETRSRFQELALPVREEFAHVCGAARSDIESVMQLLKSQPVAERQRQEEWLRAHTPHFQPSALSRHRYELIEWHDLDKLDLALITIGSHTLSHPILPSLDNAAIEHELSQSRRILEERLQRPVDLFCYPDGAQDQRVREAVSRIYRAAVTTEYGFVGEKPDPHRLRRIPVSPNLAQLAWRMHRASA